MDRGDKDGFGTATSLRSTVWHTVDDGALTEVYYPDLGTPAVRDVQLVVTDGRTFADREREDTEHVTRLIDRRSLSYRQVNTDREGLYRITKTYTTDPARAVVLVHVRFRALTRRPLQVYVLYDPDLSNAGDDDAGASGRGGALVASDAKAASAVVAAPGFTATSSGYLGASDGWTDLAADFRMDWRYATAANGNVVQTARTRLTGRRGGRTLSLALGFAPDARGALAVARTSLGAGFAAADARYRAGWRDYLRGLRRPRAAAGHEQLYDTSLMVMAALEDKTYRGAGIAAPSMSWVWGQLAGYSGPYHLVWSRDLYQVATAQLAAGDRAAAVRALDHLFGAQQEPDGCLPQNANLDGSPHWGGLQLDEVADPILLAWQLGRTDAATWGHVRLAAECILANGPVTQERWENEDGYSPASIGAEIAGLVAAGEIAARNGAAADAVRYRAAADDWRSRLDAWTVTANGPLSADPYFLRLSVDGNANAGTAYELADGGPVVDQRTVVDPSFLELVRLGVRRADDPAVRSTLPVVDRELAVDTPSGRFWHRYTHDGYGETATGGPFGSGSSRTTASAASGRSSRASAGSTSWPPVSCRATCGGRAPPPGAASTRSPRRPATG